MRLTTDEVTAVGNALLAQVFNLSIPTIRRIVGNAGIDAGQIPARSEARGGQGSRAEIVPVIQRLFHELSPDRKERALPILAEQIIANSRGSAQDLERLLAQHGFRYKEGRFFPVNAFDEKEREFLPATSFDEVADGFARLAVGDDSGAITKACGAVDTLTQSLYANHPEWGSPPDSFQAKVNTAFKRLAVFDNLKQELIGLGIGAKDAGTIVEEMKDATNHAAQVLQVLRRTMGDVHGTKPALRKTAYDSIKWASAICGLLEGEASSRVVRQTD